MAYVTTDLSYVIFDSRAEANAVLKNIDEIVDTYERVSVADIKDLINQYGRYDDYKVYWTKQSIRMHTTVGKVDGKWAIYLPRVYVDERSRSAKISYRKYGRVRNNETKTASEPIYITINTETVDDPANAICTVLQHAMTVDDRVINISIV